jgi:hypothetical protein
MNWRAFIQYLGLIGVNCAEIHTIKQLTDNTVWIGLASAALLTMTWGAYIELAVGGILFRPDNQGNRNFQIKGLSHQLVWPLVYRQAWRPDFWDLNYYTVLVGTTAAYSWYYL